MEQKGSKKKKRFRIRSKFIYIWNFFYNSVGKKERSGSIVRREASQTSRHHARFHEVCKNVFGYFILSSRIILNIFKYVLMHWIVKSFLQDKCVFFKPPYCRRRFFFFSISALLDHKIVSCVKNAFLFKPPYCRRRFFVSQWTRFWG